MFNKDSRPATPWFKEKFDLEGLGFGGLALALAIIVGGIPYIGGILSFLFWIAFIVILFASRDNDRTSPTGKSLVLAPCDGILIDVSTVAPPREVRWDIPEVKRVRISSAPYSANGVRAPMTGNVESFLEEEGAPAALALKADDADLREAFMLFVGEEGVVGLRLATGGLGPRLDIDLEAGDGVRSGRKIGVRRLGGWCDIYLPLDAEVTLLPGMKIIGGETVLSDLSGVTFEHKPFVREPEVPESQEIVVEENVVPEETVEVTAVEETSSDVSETPTEDPKA